MPSGSITQSGWQELRLAANGLTFHAVTAGPTEAPLVVLLHGFPEFWYGWRHQIGPLAMAGLRVVAPDQRGYNLSDKPAGIAAYRLDRLAEDVLGLAAALGRERFMVVGHDWGAAVAWHLAARYPQHIERAAMLNAPHPAVLRDYLLRHPSQMAKSWYMAMLQIPGMPEAMLRAVNFALLARTLRRTSRPGTFSGDDLAHYREAWAQPGALTAMLNWYRALRHDAWGLAVPRVRVPVRVIWGDRDAFLNQGLVEVSAALCDAADSFHLASATHWVQHEESDAANHLLIDFLRSGR